MAAAPDVNRKVRKEECLCTEIRFFSLNASRLSVYPVYLSDSNAGQTGGIGFLILSYICSLKLHR